MKYYDLFINERRPVLVLYVRQGAGLPDFVQKDKDDWIFDGTATGLELPSDVVQSVAVNGHAFRDVE